MLCVPIPTWKILIPSNLNQLLTTPNHLSLTSNTTMSITLAEHLLSNQGKIEIKTLTDAFQAALVQSPTRTYNKKTHTWLLSPQSQETPPFNISEAVNRVVPLSILFPTEKSRCQKEARVQAVESPAFQEGAAAAAISLLLALVYPNKLYTPQLLVENLLPYIQTPELKKNIENLPNLYIAQPATVVSLFGTSSKIEESLPLAFWLALRFKADYRTTLLTTLTLKNRARNVAPLVGAIVGALNGELAIPQIWRDKLEQKDRLLSLSNQLCELSEATYI